jgi:hypothetical protein
LQMRGDGDQDDLLAAALDLNRETHDRQCEITTLTLMGNSALAKGDTLEAAHFYGESLLLCQAIGDRTTMANIALLERIATLALASSQPGHASRLLGASDALRQELGSPIMPYLRPIHERCMEQASTQIHGETLDEALADGRQLTPEAAVRLGLAVCEHAQIGNCRNSVSVPGFAPTVERQKSTT